MFDDVYRFAASLEESHEVKHMCRHPGCLNILHFSHDRIPEQLELQASIERWFALEALKTKHRDLED